MKNIIKISLISLITLSFLNSCRDAIDIVQDGEINNQQTFKTVADLQKYLLGDVYKTMSNTGPVTVSALFTDETGLGSANSTLTPGMHQFFLDPSDATSSSLWLSNYTTINRVNRLLAAAELITPATSAEQITYNSVIAQARVIRAFAYFTLETYFSTDLKNDDALGVILTTKVPVNDEKLPRVKNSEIFALIDSDLSFADTNLVDNTNYFYISKNFINAFKARYYLYRGKHALAKQFATKVINESGLSLVGVNTLPTSTPGSSAWHTSLNSYASTSAIAKMYNDKERGEIIFALSRPTSGSWTNIGTIFNTNSSTLGGSPLYDMGRNLFNILDSTPGDIRRYIYVDPTSKIDANYATNSDYKNSDVLVIDKYPGKYQGTNPLRNDEKVFRLSEMYLILAECAVVENDFVTAAGYIKQIRDKRNYLGPVTLPTYTSAAQAYSDILLERRVELAFEGHRYIDLKRLGALANKSIDRHPTDDVSTVPTTLPVTDYRFTLPIPRNEVQGNPSITQNPGYK